MDSPAKLNLGLRIIGRRPDGYHHLESLFWPIDLADDLIVNEEEGEQSTIIWAEDAPMPVGNLPGPEQNLARRALSSTGGRGGVSIRKRIPLGAGLGGGSSNAATVLRYFRD